MPDEIANSVLVLQRDNAGKFIHHETLPLADLHNTVPGYGDRIALLLDEAGLLLMEVVGRYFLRYIEEKTQKGWLTWVLIVEEADHDFELDDFLVAIYKEDHCSRGSSPEPEVLDRSNRDPEYWTHERKMALQREREARLEAMRKAEEE